MGCIGQEPQESQVVCRRHGLRWDWFYFFWHFNSSHHHHFNTTQGPYCEASGSVYWCLKVALFRFDFLISFSHPFPLPPVVTQSLLQTVSCFSCPPSPWMQWFSFIQCPTQRSSLWTRPWAQPPQPLLHGNRESNSYSGSNYRSLEMYELSISGPLGNHIRICNHPTLIYSMYIIYSLQQPCEGGR